MRVRRRPRRRGGGTPVTRTSTRPAARAKRRNSAGVEAEPCVGLVAHRLVGVARVVEHDERPTGRAKARELPEDAGRLRRVMQDSRREHGVRAGGAPGPARAVEPDGLEELGPDRVRPGRR